MVQIIQDTASFRASRAWGSRDIATIEGASVRLHWTDEPYHWHVNRESEVFCVVAGEVSMRYRVDGNEHVAELRAGDIFVADAGDEHVAHPNGEARILVIERQGAE